MIPIAKPLLGEEEKKAISSVIDSSMVASGPRVEEFEKRFAEFVGTKFGIATTSGTTALHITLLGLGIGEGDEVIVPSFSFIASANVVLFCGATPVFCDVDPRTFNIDVEKIKSMITERTKAVMPVHLYGQPVDIDPVLEVAEKHDLFVVGDAAQAHGARYHDRMVGGFGDAECFSFYPTKNMTTGEGGMVTTDNEVLAERLYSLRNHGREKTVWGYDHGRIGYNYRMTDLQGTIGLEQLKKLPGFIEERRVHARYFDEKLEDVEGIEIPYVLDDVLHVYHQYTIKCDDRESCIQELKRNDVGFGIYYPKPLHFYDHLKQYGHGDLKNSETLADTVLSLPVHPSLSNQDLERIVGCF